LHEVAPIAGAIVNAKLADPAEEPCVAEIVKLDPLNPRDDLRPGYPIPQFLQPLREFFDAPDYDYLSDIIGILGNVRYA